MKDFVASVVVKGDASGGKKALGEIRSESTKTGKAVDRLSKSTTKGAASTKTLGTAAQTTTTKTRALAASERDAASAATQMGTANRGAASDALALAKNQRVASGTTGNLFAQLNDVGVTAIGGMSPMTIAIQQGTQMIQVMGPLGAAGSVKALGGAFMQMLNPMNLVVLGSIAGVAALVQWTMGLANAGGEAETFQDRLDELASKVADYRSATETAGLSTAELEKRFGSAGKEAASVAASMAGFARVEAVRSMDAAVADLTERFGGLSRTAMSSLDNRPVVEIIGTLESLKAELGLTEEQAVTVIQRLEQMANAQTMGQKVAAAAQLSAAFKDVFGSVENIPLPLFEAAQEAQRLALQAAELVSTTNNARAAQEQYYASRIAGEEQLASLRQRELTDLAAIHGAYAQSRVASDQQVQSAKALLANMVAQNSLQQTIAKHGVDSAQATALRAVQERAVFEEMLATKGVSEGLKDQLRGAFLIQQDIASTDMSGQISHAANEAARLAQNLVSASLANARQGQNADIAAEDAAMGVSVLPTATSVVQNQRAAGNVGRILTREADKQSRGAASGGGGRSARSAAAKAAERERKAVTDLITGLNDELAILRETNPLQQEMLRHREALKGATVAERAEVEKLIKARLDETNAAETQRELWDTWRSVASDTLSELRQSGGDFGSVLDSLSGKLLTMIENAVLLGEGPLANLFGTANGGGLVDAFLGAVAPSLAPANVNAAPAASIPARAAGGMIYGPGSGTSDDILMNSTQGLFYASQGEFMVNSAATQKNRHLLEVINSGGTIPGFAKGGSITGGSSSGGNTFAPTFVIENQSGTPIQGDVQEENDGSGGRQFKLVLADEVGSALTQKAGGARRALRTGYGVKSKGTRR